MHKKKKSSVRLDALSEHFTARQTYLAMYARKKGRNNEKVQLNLDRPHLCSRLDVLVQSCALQSRCYSNLQIISSTLGPLKMPGCAAVGCHNRSEKGYIMKCFPRDQKLRKLWQERVARADWEPSNNSFLCHVHFEPEEWVVTQKGRIRLKKTAVPSIFNITSTRKSPKKRKQCISVKNEIKNDNVTEYLGNDTKYSLIDQEKDFDSQDMDDPTIESFAHRSLTDTSLEITETSRVSSPGRCKDAMRQIVLLILDDNNTETGSNARGQMNTIKDENSIGNPAMRSSSTEILRTVVSKVEVKRDIDQNSEICESYDEIEEKLKEICDGYRGENISNDASAKPDATIPVNGKGIHKQSQVPFHRSINYKYSPRNQIGDMLADNTGNIEIIFGSESGEEYVPKRTSHQDTGTIDEIDKAARYSTGDDRVVTGDAPEIEKSSTGPTYAEETLEGESVAPNMQAAMKRKRRTREEIMRSVKKSIRSTCSQNTNSLSNSDVSDKLAGTENKTVRSSSAQYDKDATTNTAGSALTRFTVKVTGDRDDVVDIMQDLFKDTNDFTIERHGADTQQENDAEISDRSVTSVTSVIMIDHHHPMDKSIGNDTLTSSFTSSRSNDEGPIYRPETARPRGCEVSQRDLEEQPNDDHVISNIARDEYQKLQDKVKMQEEIIKRLSGQLISYKDLEKNLQNKNLETRTKGIESHSMREFNGRSTLSGSTMSCKKPIDPRQRSPMDPSNRINCLEEMNKQLMKTVTFECQQKRKLEGQIKQKDNQIKELNWKLEKASKFLERAEKNTNTYRRKMLNMQTFMRRKKLSDEKLSRFNEMLMDSAKEGYSEKTLAMVKEMEEICGTDGYSKLLNFGFPLPALSALHDSAPSENLSKDSHETTCNEIAPAPVSLAEHNKEPDTEYFATTTELDDTETVTGTVQDIFDENNDGDDFSTNELREHFILQLNAVM